MLKNHVSISVTVTRDTAHLTPVKPSDKDGSNICKYDHLEPEKDELADSIPGL